MTAMSPGLRRLVRFLVLRSRRAAPITPGRSSDLPRRVQGRRRDGLFIALPSCQTGRAAMVTRAIAACYRPGPDKPGRPGRAVLPSAAHHPDDVYAREAPPGSGRNCRTPELPLECGSLLSTGSDWYGRVDNGDQDAAIRTEHPRPDQRWEPPPPGTEACCRGADLVPAGPRAGRTRRPAAIGGGRGGARPRDLLQDRPARAGRSGARMAGPRPP